MIKMVNNEPKLMVGNQDFGPLMYESDDLVNIANKMLESAKSGNDFVVDIFTGREDRPRWIKVVCDNFMTFYIAPGGEKDMYVRDAGKLDLAKELLLDFESAPEVFGDVIENTDFNQYNEAIGVLNEAVAEIEKIPELGNLLFGNSFGEYRVDRGLQDIFQLFLTSANFDGYGRFGNMTKANARGGFSNKVFEINPYYWGDDEEEAIKANFIYYPDNLEIRWYKYPLRDSYSSKRVSEEYLREVLSACYKSMMEEQI